MKPELKKLLILNLPYLLSVSYTHLDVYKRQALERVGAVLVVSFVVLAESEGDLTFDAASVSYTHLLFLTHPTPSSPRAGWSTPSPRGTAV